MTNMSEQAKEEFEKIEERIEEKRDSFQKDGEDTIKHLKDAKEGWENPAVEAEDKHRIAMAEETHQTH